VSSVLGVNAVRLAALVLRPAWRDGRLMAPAVALVLALLPGLAQAMIYSCADESGRIRLGVFFRDENRPRYDEIRQPPRVQAAERITLLNAELDKYAV